MSGSPDRDSHDLFLSHASADKPWVRTLSQALAGHGLRVFLDEQELRPADNWVLTLDRGVQNSRFLVLVFSRHAAGRPWVEHEWTSFLAKHGPVGRLIVVRLDDTPLPAFLAALQAIRERDAARAAEIIAGRVGRLDSLPVGDVRRQYIGQDLVFVLRPDGDSVQVTDPAGRTRSVDAPWRTSSAWTAARLGFDDLARRWLTEDGDRRMLVRDATTLGRDLFDVLFGEPGLPLLAEALTPGRPRPLLVVRSDDDALLALPWELLHYAGTLPGRSVPLSSFLVRDGYLDVARTTLDEVAEGALLRPPQGTFKLVVNVSAPQTITPLSYEKESYRITIALTEHCRPMPTELGTLDDLVQTVAAVKPMGIHFSGHGYRGGLTFEGEEGEERRVPTGELITRLRAGSDGRLPPFFYLASCHGNEPGQDGAESSAAQLHRAGVAQVVGYFGPIHDHLSTRAEAALYAAIAEGQTTNYAVRQARQTLAAPLVEADAALHLRDEEGLALPSYLADAGLLPQTGPEPSATADQARHGMPFAWAQMVMYHRGPDYPLSAPVAAARRADEEGPQRESEVDPRRLLLDEPADAPRRLLTGFIGRRRELHAIRRKKRREGARAFIFQGLGGLGKTTLAFHMLSLLGEPEDVCTLWCHLAEKQSDRVEALLQQFLDYCRKRVECWDARVAEVEREPDAARRFLAYVQLLLQAVPRLVLYLDNLESLMAGPPEDDSQPPRAEAFAEWAPPQAGGLWRALRRLARDNRKLYLVASCRYCHADFGDDRMPVERLTDDALYRMMEWFPGLRRLAALSRAVLVARLNGHPRQVEYANDLIESRLAQWTFPRARTREYVQREWAELVHPVLPSVQGKLWDNLLLGAIWQRVLNDRERRMLYRMTLLRRPWARKLTMILGEPEELESMAQATQQCLERTSLLEVRGPERGLFALHPATTYAALGQAEKAIGYHEQALAISREIKNRRGEGVDLIGLGIAYARLGQAEKAVGLLEQALQIGQEVKDPIIVQEVSAALTRLGRPPRP